MSGDAEQIRPRMLPGLAFFQARRATAGWPWIYHEADPALVEGLIEAAGLPRDAALATFSRLFSLFGMPSPLAGANEVEARLLKFIAKLNEKDARALGLGIRASFHGNPYSRSPGELNKADVVPLLRERLRWCVQHGAELSGLGGEHDRPPEVYPTVAALWRFPQALYRQKVEPFPGMASDGEGGFFDPVPALAPAEGTLEAAAVAWRPHTALLDIEALWREVRGDSAWEAEFLKRFDFDLTRCPIAGLLDDPRPETARAAFDWADPILAQIEAARGNAKATDGSSARGGAKGAPEAPTDPPPSEKAKASPTAPKSDSDWLNEQNGWDYSKGPLQLGEVAYMLSEDGQRIESREGKTGPQTLEALQLGTECEGFVEATLAKMGIPPILKREDAHGEARYWGEGEKLWAGRLRVNGNIVYITEPKQLPAEIEGYVGANGLQHPRLSKALILRDFVDRPPSKEPFAGEPTYEEWLRYQEDFYKLMVESDTGKRNATWRDLQTKFDQLPEEAKRLQHQKAIQDHYGVEARKRKRNVEFARRAHRLTILSLIAHWWMNVLAPERKAKLLAAPPFIDPVGPRKASPRRPEEKAKSAPPPEAEDPASALLRIVKGTGADDERAGRIAQGLRAKRKRGHKLLEEAKVWLEKHGKELALPHKAQGWSRNELRAYLSRVYGIALHDDQIQSYFPRQLFLMDSSNG